MNSVMNVLSALTRRLGSSKAPITPLMLMLLASALVTAAKQPPSSQERPGAVIRFSHSHERVASCRLQTDTLKCTAHRVPAAAGIAFRLTPEPGQLVSKPTAERDPVPISLPSREGTSSLELRVRSGNWALSWADQNVAFYVEKQRDFAIQLQTTSGACVFEEGQCRRHDDALSHNVLIPAESLGAL